MPKKKPTITRKVYSETVVWPIEKFSEEWRKLGDQEKKKKITQQMTKRTNSLIKDISEEKTNDSGA